MEYVAGKKMIKPTWGRSGVMSPPSMLKGDDSCFMGCPGDDLPLTWYAVQTRPRHEKRIAQELRGRLLEEFLPLHRCRHRWKNGVVADLELPLFPCYLFVRSSVRDKIRLLQLPGVVGLAVCSSHPTAIPDSDIQALRALLTVSSAEPHPFQTAGDRVRIVAGPLAGMEGVLTGKKQKLRVVLSLDIIMRSVAVEVGDYDIEPLSYGQRRAF